MSESEDQPKQAGAASAYEFNAVYTLESVERITHLSREEIVLYYEYGLISPVKKTAERELYFDEQAIHRLRRVARLLSGDGIHAGGLKMISSLLDEVERLREEVRFLRER